MTDGNRFKEGLAAGRRLIGCWSSFASPMVSEILAGADLDWILIDMEHAPNDLSEVLVQLQVLAGGKPHPIVRVPSNDRIAIRRLSDIGVDCFLVPFVETADQARYAVQSALYPPEGMRGMAGSMRAAAYGRRAGYQQEANAGICVLVQIESRLAVENLAEIAAVPGLGGLFVGPSDLSAGMGFVGQPYHPKMLETIAEVVKVGQEAGLPVGSIATDPKAVGTFLEMGMNYLAIGSDVSIFVRALDEAVARWRPEFD